MSNQITRRAALAATAALGFSTLTSSLAVAQGQQFPTGPVRIVLPFPPGTVNDVITRILAERLSQRWKQTVTVDNRPGASSMIGTANVAQASPDGHTLLVNITLMIQNPALRTKLPYDPNALVPVTQINRQQLPIFVRSDLGIDSMTKLLSYAHAKPGVINFATWGIGSTAHIMLEAIQKDKGVKMVHVPYKGGASIIQALLADESDVGVADFLSPTPYFKNGKLRVIAVTGPRRVPDYPDAPTLGEIGVSGFEGYNWLGMFAPTGTPPAVIQEIASAIADIQKDPALIKRFREDMLVEPTGTSPAEFRKIYEQDEASWKAVIKASGIKLD